MQLHALAFSSALWARVKKQAMEKKTKRQQSRQSSDELKHYAKSTAPVAKSRRRSTGFMLQPSLDCPRRVAQVCARAATNAGSYPDELPSDRKA